MRTSDNGRRFIEAFEGRFLKTYDDGGGVWTIGYGHTTAAGPPKVLPGMTITDDQCDQILSSDLIAVERDVSKIITVPLTQYQFDALVSFHFNTGALKSGTIDDKLNSRRDSEAMATLLLYTHDNGKEVSGLVRRRKAEKLMFEGNVQSAMALAGAHVVSGERMPQGPQPVPIPTPPPPDIPKPAPPQPASSGLFAALINALAALFKRNK